MPEIIVRRLARGDLDSGFLESLDALRPASNMAKERAGEVFDEIGADPHYVVIVAERKGRIIGTGTLLLERKFIHDGGRAAHIEDLAVHVDEQRAGVGAKIVERLIAEARQAGCYKVVLECAEDLVPFHEANGLSLHSVAMRKSLD